MPDLSTALSTIGSSALASVAISSVTVETQFTPTYTYVPGPSGAAPAGGALSSLNPLALLRPKFTVQLAGGGPPIVVAPYGEPTGNYLPHAFGVAGLAVAGFALYKGAKALAKWAAIGGAIALASGYLQNQPQPVTQ